jgi:predicted Zn-dependent peptidase
MSFVRAALILLTIGTAALGAQAPGAQQPRPDRSKPPALGPRPQLTLPAIVKRTLSNGLPVWLIEAHEVPLAQINLIVLAGSGDDPPGRFGVASLTSAMLDEGAGNRNALDLADAVEFLGASLGVTSSFDASAVRLNVPVARLQDALPLLADVALRPTFPEKELERLRQERITSLLQARDDPASVAPMAFSRIVFGAMHRYGTGAIGTETSLKTLTTTDLRAFHASMYQPSNATLVAVGDFRIDSVMPLLEKQFGAWQSQAAAVRRPVPAAPQLERRHVTIVDIPKAEQSQIRIGSVGVARSTPDYFPLQVLNTILGGSFTSRLNQNLREKNQYTYGASSRFDMRLSPGSFAAGAGVQTDKTAEALREFFAELSAIVKPVGADELTKAKNYIALGFPGAFETVDDLASNVEELVVYKLKDDYFARYVANIESVTAADVARVAAAHIQPQRMAVVIAGDRAAIEPGIRALGLGPVRVMSVSEALGP